MLQTDTSGVAQEKHKMCIWQLRRRRLRTSSFWTLVIGSWQQWATARAVPVCGSEPKCPVWRSDSLRDLSDFRIWHEGTNPEQAVAPLCFQESCFQSWLPSRSSDSQHDLSARPAPPDKSNGMEKDKLCSKRYKEEEHVNGFELQRLCKS